MTPRSTGRRVAVPLVALAVLLPGCGGGATTEGACEEGRPDCVDEDTVDVVSPPADAPP